jgi:signal transduction histidine kinase
MRSLFARILLWFLVTTAITVTGFMAIAAFSIAELPDRQRPFSRLVPFQLGEARHAYETGGKPALAAFLQRLEAAFQAEGILTDAQGRDLLTGENRSELISAARQRRRTPFFRRRSAVIGRTSEDGRYWFFFLIPGPRVSWWVLSPRYLWVLGAVILLCYVLARLLSRPLRDIEGAVARFGQGDFSARTGASERRDEFGRLARTFDDMAARIQTLLAAERRLLLDISHELRSPLARLNVAVELARTGDDRQATLNRIQKEADRLNALVGELLQVTRAEGDPSALRFEPLRLDEAVRTVAEDSEIEAQSRGNTVRLQHLPETTVNGDPELLRRAIENIVRNAIRYAPPDTPVEIGLRSSAGRVVLSIRDHGPGVPDEDLARIFDPFYRVNTDRDRSTGGVGLGLAIARRAVQLHHGSLRASNANPGLLVELELPAG